DRATHSATISATYSATLNATLSATYSATDSATLSATNNATYSATNSATLSATLSATDSATRSATLSATDRAGFGAISACYEIAGDGGIACARRAWRMLQGGNEWAATPAFIAFGRDHARLADNGAVTAEQYDIYEPWETLARLSGWRFVHSDFCIVSDRPVTMHVDDAGRLHNPRGPARLWADGFAIYQIDGVPVPSQWVEAPALVDPRTVLLETNNDTRSAGGRLFGWGRILEGTRHRVLDDSGNPTVGQLIEFELPGLDEPVRALRAECPRNGTFVEFVRSLSDIDGLAINTALAAQAWRIGDPLSEYQHPPRRT
ncbi:MAG: DUF6745 domain-containing protein, partial [Bosea sp. (in: a-proteobacteria)]